MCAYQVRSWQSEGDILNNADVNLCWFFLKVKFDCKVFF